MESQNFTFGGEGARLLTAVKMRLREKCSALGSFVCRWSLEILGAGGNIGKAACLCRVCLLLYVQGCFGVVCS